MRLLLALTFVLVMLGAAVGAAQAAYDVHFTSITVNPNHTMTVNWWLDPESDSSVTNNATLTVDGHVVRDWTSGDSRATSSTSYKPYTPGHHTVSLTTITVFWSNKYYESLDCSVSRRDSYIWVCVYDETVTRSFDVSGHGSSSASAAKPSPNACLVPDVVGLRLQGREGAPAPVRLHAWGDDAGDLLARWRNSAAAEAA